MAILMIPCSKLTDRWGRKRCFIAGLVLYGIGALLSAAAPGLAVLILGNSVLEGVGTALLIPPVYILATLHFSDLTSRARAFGVISGMGGIGAADRRGDHDRHQLAGGVRLSGRDHRRDRPAQPAHHRPRAGGSDAPVRRLRGGLSAVGMFFLVFGILQADTDGVLMAVLLAAGAAFLAWFFLYPRPRAPRSAPRSPARSSYPTWPRATTATRSR
jgi:hypothetical protein